MLCHRGGRWEDVAVAGEGWNRTAVMMSAVGTLLAGVAAVLAFGLDWVSLGGSKEPETIVDAKGSPVGTISEKVYWQEARVLIDEDLDVDQPDGPVRNTDAYNEKDLYYFWTQDGLKPTVGMVRWEGGNPTAAACAKKLRAQGSTNQVEPEAGMKFCVRSTKGRTFLLETLPKTESGWEYKVTVWADRTP